MYRMSESEFMQYEIAERRLQELKEHHAIEVQQAYDDIHPTRTGYNYLLGRVYSESVNPAEYAIYIVELKEEHERIEKWWALRADAYKKATSFLTDEEKKVFNSFTLESYKTREKVRRRLRELLESIISITPELQRKSIPLDDLEDIEEVDRRIDQMSMTELLEDYWDRDDSHAAIASGV